MATEQTASTSIKLEAYEAVLKKAEQLKDSIDDQNLVRGVQALLKKVNDFCAEHKCECQYRLAVPKDTSDKELVAQAGIEVGKVQMPKTLIKYLLGKCKEDRPSKNRLFAMLLKHQRFSVAIVKNRIRIKIQ